jgi:hypothetical protein
MKQSGVSTCKWQSPLLHAKSEEDKNRLQTYNKASVSMNALGDGSLLWE